MTYKEKYIESLEIEKNYCIKDFFDIVKKRIPIIKNGDFIGCGRTLCADCWNKEMKK